MLDLGWTCEDNTYAGVAIGIPSTQVFNGVRTTS